MNSKTRSFKWTKMRFRRGLAASLVIFMILPLLLPAMALATPSGGGDSHPPCTDATYEGDVDPGPNVISAPEGYIIKTVWIKAGSDQHGDGHIEYTDNTTEGGYSVSGIGTRTVTVTRTGSGPDIKEISHIDVCWDPEPEPEPTYGLHIDKSVEDGNIVDGEETTFTIVVTNTGDATLTDVLVEDALPSGLDYVDSNPDSDSSAPNLSWTIAELAPGAQNAWTATVTVTGDNEGSSAIEADNLAIASQEERELEEQAHAIVVVNPTPPTQPTYGLEIEKSVEDGEIVDGEETTFTIVVTNTGDATLTDVLVEDALPSGLDYVDSNPDSDSSAPNLSWTIAELAPGAQNAWTATVTVTGDNEGSSAIEADNLAIASQEERELEEQAHAIVVVNPVGEPPRQLDTTYTITKTDSSDTIVVGENTTYTITVVNVGETTLTDVSVYDAMPSGLEYVSADPAPYMTSPSLGWLLPDLGPGDSYVIKVTAKALTVGTWTNRAHVHVGEAPALYADEDTKVEATPPLLPPAALPATFDLSISKKDDVDPAYVGDAVTYTVTVKNTGDQTLTDLVFDDSLPSGLAFKSSNVGSLKAAGGVATWSVAKLEPGQSQSFRITTTAKKAGNWLNTVSVRAVELPTARQASERTKVLARVAAAPATSDADPTSTSGGGTLPLTGFETWTWFLTASLLMAAGLWLELKVRRGKQ